MKNLNKIISTLSLAASDTRDDTIKSIIKFTLFEGTSPVSISELKENIDVLFDIGIYDSELKANLGSLEKEGEILSNKGQYQISDNEKERLSKLDFKLKTDEKNRYENFCKIIEENFKEKLEKDDTKDLWKSFKEYLYNSFFIYGIKAVEYLHPTFKSKGDTFFNSTENINDVTSKLSNPGLGEILKKVIDKYFDFANDEDIEFINELGQKTLAFTSLGISREEANDSFEKELVDWTLYLDTNFLYSVLDLHVNNENDACKELLSLVIKNKNLINIKFRYTESTLKELRHKKEDFENLDSTLTDSAIRGLLKSEDIDEFSRKYYASLLSNRDETIHPTQIVDLAEVTLPSKNIEITRNKARIDSLGDNYLDIKVQDYQKFIDDQNAYRETYAQEHTIKLRSHFRSDGQKYHDITLRELILSLRSSGPTKITTFNQVKYFGITLDELLIKYDTHELRKETTKQYPTFFRPSFLLNQLVKVLPVKTDNYKKAFIKAVSARGFHKDARKSNEILKIVSYLKSQGIDNEDIILNLISEKLFLDDYHKKRVLDNFEEKAFFEAELNKLYERKAKEVEEAQRKAGELEKKQILSEGEKGKLKTDLQEIVKEKDLYLDGLNKLKKKVSILEKKIEKPVDQPQINFEASERDKKIKELEDKLGQSEREKIKQENEQRKIGRDSFYKLKLRKWRWQSIIEVAISVLVFIGSIVYLLYLNNWNARLTFQEIQKLNGNVIFVSVVWIASLIFNVFFIKGLYEKFRNHSNIVNYKNSLQLPDNLKEISQ